MAKNKITQFCVEYKVTVKVTNRTIRRDVESESSVRITAMPKE